MYVLLNAHLTTLLNSNLSYIIIMKSIVLNEEYRKNFIFIFSERKVMRLGHKQAKDN